MTGPRREVGCTLAFRFLEPSVLALQVAPCGVSEERFEVEGAAQPEEVVVYGNRTQILRAAAGDVVVRYSATITDDGGGRRHAEEFSEDVVVARRQSRYCPSDTMADFALRELGASRNGDDIGERAASWVFERIQYASGTSTSADSAIDTLLAGRGVCRDFAHLTIAMLRALNVPARLVSVYAPGVSPMDFHAVVEVWRNRTWWVIDPTRLAPRSSLVRIASGRDAADTAFAATITGDVELVSSEVFAVVEGTLPIDAHDGPATLR